MATANPQTGTIEIPTDSSVNETLAAAARSKLPKRSKNIERTVRRAFITNQATRQALFAAKQDVHKSRADLTFQITHLEHDIAMGKGPIGPADHQRLADLKAQRDALSADIAETDADIAALPSAYEPTPITAWLAANAGKRFKSSTVTISLKKGQTARAALDEVRAAIKAALAEIDAVEGAELPVADAITNAIREIERIAARGEPYMGRCRLTEARPNGRTRVGDIRWPKWFDAAGVEHGDAFALAVWANKEMLIAKARADLTAMASEGAVSLTDRKARAAEIRGQILALEYQEGALLEMLAAEGKPTSARADMNVAALLRVEIDDRPLPEPKPDTDPGDTPEQIAADIKRSRKRDRTAHLARRSDGADPNDFG